MLYVHSEIVIILNRGVLWLRKREVFIGFIGKWETRQCIINNNEFHNHFSTWLHRSFYATPLVFIFSFFFFTSITLSPSVFFFSCMTLLTPTFICSLSGKKDKRFFFLLCCLWLISLPHPVSCVFSPISGILRSPPSMWVTLMCAAGLSCRAGSSPLCNLGVLCVCLCVWIMSCVYFCACNPLGVNPHERS